MPLEKNQLCRADTGDAVLAAMKHNHEKLTWHCRLCLLMPDHLHAILAFPSGAHGVTRPTNQHHGAQEVVRPTLDKSGSQEVECPTVSDQVGRATPCAPGMATAIRNWKKYVAGKHGVDWQRDFFDHRLRDHYELEEKASYILMNPVRKGLCERVEDWVWVYRPNNRTPPLLG